VLTGGVQDPGGGDIAVMPVASLWNIVVLIVSNRARPGPDRMTA
jgi:hypothetical protein